MLGHPPLSCTGLSIRHERESTSLASEGSHSGIPYIPYPAFDSRFFTKGSKFPLCRREVTPVYCAFITYQIPPISLGNVIICCAWSALTRNVQVRRNVAFFSALFTTKDVTIKHRAFLLTVRCSFYCEKQL